VLNFGRDVFQNCYSILVCALLQNVFRTPHRFRIDSESDGEVAPITPKSKKYRGKVVSVVASPPSPVKESAYIFNDVEGWMLLYWLFIIVASLPSCLSPGRIKLKIEKLVFTASLLDTQG